MMMLVLMKIITILKTVVMLMMMLNFIKYDYDDRDYEDEVGKYYKVKHHYFKLQVSLATQL